MAVFCSPFIIMSLNAGITTRLSPVGATKPRHMAIALMAWFRDPAPTVWISTSFFSL